MSDCIFPVPPKTAAGHTSRVDALVKMLTYQALLIQLTCAGKWWVIAGGENWWDSCFDGNLDYSEFFHRYHPLHYKTVQKMLRNEEVAPLHWVESPGAGNNIKAVIYYLTEKGATIAKTTLINES